MDSYTSMKTKLNATGFYTVQEGTALNRELIAYSQGLSLLFDELKEMLRELFIHTAQTYGIENRERFVGKTHDEYTLEKRREMLIITESNIGTGCTLNDFTKTLNGYGLENFEFIENPTNKHIAHATTTNIGLQVYEVNFFINSINNILLNLKYFS